MEEIRELQRQATSWNELIFVFFFSDSLREPWFIFSRALRAERFEKCVLLYDRKQETEGRRVARHDMRYFYERCRIFRGICSPKPVRKTRSGFMRFWASRYCDWYERSKGICDHHDHPLLYFSLRIFFFLWN